MEPQDFVENPDDDTPTLTHEEAQQILADLYAGEGREHPFSIGAVLNYKRIHQGE